MEAAMQVERAPAAEAETAFSIVAEYNEAVGVVVRDAPGTFVSEYFADGSGVWLARVAGELAGCVALRPLHARDSAGEIKRLYVRPQWRGQGVAEALLSALEEYARQCRYSTLYLDSKDDLLAALRFYARHGYAPCERYNNNPQATVFMRKQL